mgnify:CR=1 FL=1
MTPEATKNLSLTPEEECLIQTCDNPDTVQSFLDGLEYNWEPTGPTLRSFRRVVRDRVAHCMEGALSAAAFLSHHGYPAQLLCMEARDIDHIVFPFQKKGLWGSVAQSLDVHLKGRDPVHKTLRDLVLSYHPHYWNYWTGDRNDLTLRGFALLPLTQNHGDWVTGEEDLWSIEDGFYQLPYQALFPAPEQNQFLSRRDGGIDWIS